jgi:hypothetical protein
VNITEALGDISASYPRSEDKIGDGGIGATFEVSSGGLRVNAREPEPALYITSDAAIRAWRDQVLALLKADKAAGFSVIDGPHLDKWRITVADGKYTHRIAEDRYSVTARIGIVREAAPAVEPVIESVVPEVPKPKPARAAKKQVA